MPSFNFIYCWKKKRKKDNNIEYNFKSIKNMKDLIRFDIKYRKQIESGKAKVFFYGVRNQTLLPVRIVAWDMKSDYCNGYYYPILGLATIPIPSLNEELDMIVVSTEHGIAVEHDYHTPVYIGDELLIQLDDD